MKERKDMTEQTYWLQKIVQLLHDPPGKPYFFRPGSGGHNKLARAILKTVLDNKKEPPRRRLADLLATGADRPVLNLPWGTEGNTGVQYFHKDPAITHPLENFPLTLNHPGDSDKITGEQIEDLFEAQLTAAALSRLKKELPEDEISAGSCKKCYLMLWRRMREDIIAQHQSGGSSFLWQFMPADSRCPDHSIWEHNRLTSALAFVPARLRKGHEQEPDFPWLFSFALRPVQEFLNQARKSQDLWTGSMLLSELCWSAIKVIIEHYGPDVIVYPDLRGNPRADQWLERYEEDAIPDDRKGISTRAAVIPHTFVALLPRGGDNSKHLLSLEEKSNEACEAVAKKWAELTKDVQDWMVTLRNDPGSSWQPLWNHARDSCPVEPTWVAQPWTVLEKQKQYFLPGHALPCQKDVAEHEKEDCEVMARRYRGLGQWMEKSDWQRYEYALSVFARTHENYLLSSGFTYAPNHHKLKIRHGLRRRIITSLPKSTPPDISFEKCSICHRLAALGNEDFSKQKNSHSESIRQQVRKFWRNRKLNPDGSGSERLCAVCATKRFLVHSDSKVDNKKPNSFNRVWTGNKKDLGDIRDHNGNVRTPFPSTVQIAAQEFLVNIAREEDQLAAEMAAIVDLHKKLGLPFTSYPEALPMFAGSVSGKQLANDFFKLDPQLSLFPEMVESKLNYADEKERKDQAKERKDWEKLHNSVQKFRKAVNKLGIQPPATQIAVISMDGDKMGDLLLGKEGRIKSRWEDIIHPEFVERMRERFREKDNGWLELLNHHRLCGPSLQAFISRALADFSHTIVPWVVEQEFGGRLIYSGGDDLLALAPAAHALGICDRLQKLFSAAWVIDHQHETMPWEWLDKESSHQWDQKNAKNRFQILKENKLPDKGRLLPMLGESGSLSAGIMYGHFKTDLGTLRKYSQELLEKWAKEKSGRNGAGLGHFSRSGVKTMFGAKWNCGGGLTDNMEKIIKGFGKKGQLPGSLPYKLIDYIKKIGPDLLAEATDDRARSEEQGKIMRGLLHKAVDGERIDSALQEAVLAIWQAGFDLNNSRKPQYCLQTDSTDDHNLDGLLLCRYLASRT